MKKLSAIPSKIKSLKRKHDSQTPSSSSSRSQNTVDSRKKKQKGNEEELIDLSKELNELNFTRKKIPDDPFLKTRLVSAIKNPKLHEALDFANQNFILRPDQFLNLVFDGFQGRPPENLDLSQSFEKVDLYDLEQLAKDYSDPRLNSAINKKKAKEETQLTCFIQNLPEESTSDFMEKIKQKIQDLQCRQQNPEPVSDGTAPVLLSGLSLERSKALLQYFDKKLNQRTTEGDFAVPEPATFVVGGASGHPDNYRIIDLQILENKSSHEQDPLISNFFDVNTAQALQQEGRPQITRLVRDTKSPKLIVNTD